MRKKIKILICFLLVVSVYTKAQPLSIVGTISNKDNKPIESVSVRIINTDSIIVANGLTNSTGFFSINIPTKGDYIVSISHIGYLKQQLFLKGIVKSTNIGNLFLKESSNMLSEVVVTAKSQMNKLDKILLFPTELQKKHSTDGFSLLNNLMIPQIDVDLLKKKVSSREKPVSLLINGRPVVDNSEITVLRPQDIVRIEYHEMPTGSLAEYESVINYITKQQKFGGYIGFNGSQQTTYGDSEYLIMTRLNHENSEHTFGYIFNFLHDNKVHRESLETFIYPNDNLLYREECSDPSIEKNHTHHFFYNYNLRNNAIQINIKAGYKRYVSDTNFNSLLTYKGSSGYAQHLVNKNNEIQSNPYLSFFSDLKLKNKQSLYIRGSIDYARNHYNYIYTEKQENSTQSSLFTKTAEDYYYTALGAIYTKAFSKEREISLNLYNYTNLSKSSDNSGNDLNKERFTTSESLYLFNLSKKWAKMFLSIRLGMSSLFYFQKDKANRQYWSYRPGVTFRYIFNEKSLLQYKAALNNSFPTLSLFTNTEQNIDFIQKKVGNPSLKIVEIISNQLSYSYTLKRVNINLSFNYFHSYPSTVNQVTYDGSYFIHSYRNNGCYNFIAPELSANLKLWNNQLNFKMSGGLNRYVITGDNNVCKNDWYINSFLTLFYKKFSSYLYYYSSREGVYASLDQWKNSNRYGLVLSYNDKSFSFSIGTQNPFSNYQRTTKMNLDIYSYENLAYNQQNDHLFYIKAAFNFDFGRKHKYSEIDVKKETNSAIMKIDK